MSTIQTTGKNNIGNPPSIRYTDAFSFWGIDRVGPLVTTDSGNEYILTAIDFATGRALAYAFARRSTTAAIELVEEIVWIFGAPQQILSDNLAAPKRYKIEPNHITPGHPQTNGKVERLNVCNAYLTIGIYISDKLCLHTIQSPKTLSLANTNQTLSVRMPSSTSQFPTNTGPLLQNCS